MAVFGTHDREGYYLLQWDDIKPVFYPFKDHEGVVHDLKDHFNISDNSVLFTKVPSGLPELDTYETLFKERNRFEHTIDEYNFLMIFGSVIVLGLFNAILSIYSIRDIARRPIKNKQTTKNEVELEQQNSQNQIKALNGKKESTQV